MKTRKTIIVACFAFLLASACTPTAAPQAEKTLTTTQTEPVTIAMRGQNVDITNNTTKDVYYILVPQKVLPVILFTTTVGPQTPRIAGESTLSVPPTDIHSAQQGDTLELYWWHKGMPTSREGFFNHDSVRNLKMVYSPN